MCASIRAGIFCNAGSSVFRWNTAIDQEHHVRVRRERPLSLIDVRTILHSF
jgi:hypothetical protein